MNIKLSSLALATAAFQGLVLTTDDIAKTHIELKKRRLAISDIDRWPYGSEATFGDLDGNGWILQQTALGH